jgi:hypothetical protein
MQTAVHAPRDNDLLASMMLDAHGSRLCLRRNQNLALRDGQGWRVRTLSGVVWITQDQDSRDIVLQPGEMFTLDRNGISLLTAFENAEIWLESVLQNRAHRWPLPSWHTASARLA